MPVKVVRGSPRVLKNSLPKNLRQVGLQNLQLGRDYSEACFEGTVVIFSQLTRLQNGTPFFKIVLQESKNSSSISITINTLLFGKLAEVCARLVHQGDTVVVAGFGLAKSIIGDGRHCCHLEASDEVGSTLYICPRSSSTGKASETVAVPIAPKYSYTPLNKLKGGTVVNIYGAVKFFKLPYKCQGGDHCLVVTIVDQSNTKLICTLFSADRDTLPQIYNNGDIVRFHRIKIREFGGQMQGITSNGFAALTFDGTIGASLVPRTTSKTSTFTDEDKKIVEELRIWLAQNLTISAPAAKLCDIQPPMFFQLTCQVVGKAKVDGSSYLLKVWDGTECPFPSWKVFVKTDDLEGDGNLIHQLRNLTVDIVLYDNHVHLAESLQVGSIIRLYSLHVKIHSSEEKPDVSYLRFELHGGTGYGRGFTVLSESHTDAVQLKTFLDTVDLTSSGYSEASSFPEFETTYIPLGSGVDRCQQLSVTVLTDHQHLDMTALNTIINSRHPQEYRVRAKLRTFEPEKLHLSVKLHCPQCHCLQEVLDESELNLIIQETSASCSDPKLQNISFCTSCMFGSENQGQRRVPVYFVKHADHQNPEDSVILLEGGMVDEILKLSKIVKGIIPVKSAEDSLVLLDLSAPFFWQGNTQYYGCKHCSKPKTVSNLSCIAALENPSWDPTTIAQALGVVPLEYVFLMKFTLDDGTGSLDAYLMDCQKFFQIPASEVLTNSIFQEIMKRLMKKLCPEHNNLDQLPWLECFIRSYYVEDETEEKLCYQIFNTTIAEDV
ncbi:protection of telomeres protein 1 [Anolis carolinensis]|uniref:Protection of telomeres protein 1 n=1 Tax=Anolis carolinensis TaxID=28377 RepID=G1K9A9_ANOCA|nr:PREDICTED: protection of telomeres protein 1 [Anolis carolinensis]|eukprot:XP_008109436.1 PREDICTED: protection of telomeres protein 1 [Anolis carolinensis]